MISTGVGRLCISGEAGKGASGHLPSHDGEASLFNTVHPTRLVAFQLIKHWKKQSTRTGKQMVARKDLACSRQHWPSTTMTAEYRSMVLWQICEISHLNEEDTRRKHPDIGKSRILCGEKDVQSLVEVLQSSWVHPFHSLRVLICVACQLEGTYQKMWREIYWEQKV